MENAALWAKNNSISRRSGEDFSEEFEDEIGKMSGRCIDIGSGPCDVLVDFVLPKLDPDATVTCADISDAMLNFAKEKYGDNHRLSFLKLDIGTPDLPGDLIGQFDHATSFYCLHFCKDKRQTFENIFKLLRPGGTLLFSLIAKYPGVDCFEELAAVPRYQPYMENRDRRMAVFEYSRQSLGTLKTLMKDVGFEIHHCSIRTENYIFDTPELIRDLLFSVSPFANSMPADVRKEFGKDLTRTFARRSIIFNKSNDNEDEYSVLSIRESVIAYLRKPLAKKNSN